MATLEERMERVEHENAEIKKSVELLSIALGALVNKATLEKVNEQNSKIFDTLMRHDRFTNEQLAELRGQLTEQDGKIVGLRTEMRQEIAGLHQEVAGLHQEIAGLRTEMHQEVAGLHQEIAGLRTEMHQEVAGLRTEMHQEVAGLRTEMRQGFAEVKQDVGSIYIQLNGLEKLLIDRLPPAQ